jgi:hypothetical protein
MLRSHTSALALAFSIALCSACGGVEGDPLSAADDGLSSQLTPSQLADTKRALRALASANIDRTDNLPAVRAQVDPLVAKLARHFGTRSAVQKLPLVKGAWRQSWTDFPYPMAKYLSMDPRQTYQVVTADGYYYNLGDDTAAGFLGLTGVLRGSYAPAGALLRIRFTASGFRLGRLAQGEDLFALAQGLESGARYYFGIPGGGHAPNGPIDISGTLETLYVDGDLRVERGTQDDFKDASGKVLVPGVSAKLFLLDRVVVPAK